MDCSYPAAGSHSTRDTDILLGVGTDFLTDGSSRASRSTLGSFFLPLITEPVVTSFYYRLRGGYDVGVGHVSLRLNYRYA